jgi:hypothetical protein
MSIIKHIASVCGVVFCAGFTLNAEETKEFVLADIKPTLTGYTNNAYVTMEPAHKHPLTWGRNSYTNQELTVFTRNVEVDSPLMLAKQGTEFFMITPRLALLMSPSLAQTAFLRAYMDLPFLTPFQALKSSGVTHMYRSTAIQNSPATSTTTGQSTHSPAQCGCSSTSFHAMRKRRWS